MVEVVGKNTATFQTIVAAQEVQALHELGITVQNVAEAVLCIALTVAVEALDKTKGLFS